MPLWQIYHPAESFSEADKQGIAGQVTRLYEPFLPRFYVNVLFHALPKACFFIGGEPAGDFVRVTIDHIARSIDDAEQQRQFLKACAGLLDSYVAQRGLRWELHVDDTPFDLWTIDGHKPPPPQSAAERRWRAENRPSAYEGE